MFGTNRRAVIGCLILVLSGFGNSALAAGPPQSAASAAVRAPVEAPSLAGLDAFVERVRAAFDVPGIAVAVVKDGKIVHARGYGVRKLGEPAPVDAETLFGIASNTKAFTCAALASLVEEGKLQWDDPVIKHVPGFLMYDPYVTREMTVRDLVTHRSGLGLGAGDLLYFPETDYTRAEIVHRIRYLKPATSFRTAYAYDNILYLVAGQVIESVTGKLWDDVIRERIFAPIGMTASSTTYRALLSGNAATPHAPMGGVIRPIAPMNFDNNAPAGSINSNVSELARWMIVQLDGGSLESLKPGTKDRIFAAASGRQMWSAQTILPVGDPPPGLEAARTNFAAYGLGWFLNEFRGYKVASHTGGLPGYVSQVRLVPDLKLGVVVLTNQEVGVAFSAISSYVLDACIGGGTTDWLAAYQALLAKRRSDADEVVKKAEAARVKDSRPSMPLERYAGTYRDAWRDDVTVGVEGGKLVLRFSRTKQLVGDLEHWHYDTWVARWRDRSLGADAYVTFALRHDGTIEKMTMLPVSPATDFSYDFQDLTFVPVVEKPKE